MAVLNHTLGTDPVWVARYRVTSARVFAEAHDGRLWQCFNGACLDWLSPVQESHFLKMGLVERIDDGTSADESDADGDTLDAAVPDSGAVDECVATLARLQVPATAGAPTARTALRGNGYRYGNDVVAAAVRLRKELSGTGTDDEEFEAVKF
jgi:hypothetical protein